MVNLISNKKCTTLADANNKFIEIYPNRPQVISAINRFVLPEFGLDIKGNRLTKAEKSEACRLAETLLLDDLSREQLEEVLINSFEKQKVPKKSQKAPKSHINFYLDFLEQENLLKKNSHSVQIEEINTAYRMRNFPTRYVDKSYIEQQKKGEKKETIKFIFDPQIYLSEYRKKYPHKNEFELKAIISERLLTIESEITNIEKYLKNLNNSKETLKAHIYRIKILLGWLYKATNNLDTISVRNIIKVVNTNLNFTEYNNFEKFYFDKGKKEYEAKLEARNTRKFLENFFRDYKVNAFKTKSNYISALITLSKYLYKDITDEDEADNYEDITVIRVLRAYRRKLSKLEKQPKKITNLELTWEEIILIREHLKKDADSIYKFCFDKKRNRTVKTKRSDRAIAVSKMKFLIFCFFTVIPPDRSRTIRELSLGNSLKYGLHTNEGFIPANKLKKREDAMFYIHLRSEDYKTGKVYGEFWGKIPNMTFKDGSNFYDYINDWIYGKWRKVILGDKQHQFVFMSPLVAKPLDKDSLGSIIKHIFLSKTGIAIFPHKLRKIFCTYLDRIDASPKVRKSVARWMHHSEEMARKVYTVTDLQNELSAGFDFMTELNQKL